MRQTVTEEQKRDLLLRIRFWKQNEAWRLTEAASAACISGEYIREAADAGIPQKDIMEAAGIKRTMLHEIIHGK